VVRVADTGIGIEPELLPRVFDLFTQLDQSLNRAQGGLGIGLTMVKHLVRMHGGTVQAQSEGAGRGSEFVIQLPLIGRDEARDVQPRPAGFEQPVRDAAAARPGKRLKILVVDDNQDSANSLAELVVLWGMNRAWPTTGWRPLKPPPLFIPTWCCSISVCPA